MNAVYRATSFAVCIVIAGCGNKGDLFLNNVELSTEEKAVLENSDEKKPKKKKRAEPQTEE